MRESTQRAFLPKIALFLLLTLIGTGSSFYTPQAHAENSDLENDASYRIEQIKKNYFEIKNSQRFLTLELIQGDGSLIKLNNILMTLDLERSRRYNERLLSDYLEKILVFRSEKSEPAEEKKSLSQIIIPSAQAADWLAEGQGPHGLARIVLSIIFMNRSETQHIRKDTLGFPSALVTKRPR